MILSLGSMAQTPFMTSGRLFNIPIEKKGHLLTPKEVAEMFELCMHDIKPTTWYTLTTGLKVQILHADAWSTLVYASYKAIDDSVDVNNITKAILASDTTKEWTTSMPLTRNYYWSAYGAVAFIDNYNGTGHQAPVITYKGFPVIKRSCGNPQLMVSKAEKILAVVNDASKKVLPAKTESPNVEVACYKKQ